MARQGSPPYAGTSYRDVHAAITRSLARHDALIVVTGESGIGKTTVYRAAIETAEGAAVSTIVNPLLTFRDLIKQILFDFDRAPKHLVQDENELGLLATEHDMLRSIQQVIRSNPARLAIVVIDDAHLASPVILGQLRSLLNLSSDDQPLTVVLVGQPKLEDRLKEPAFRSVSERIAQTCRLGPLTSAEVQDYLAHTYGELDVHVTANGVSELMTVSGGVPATLNRLFEAAATSVSGQTDGAIDRLVVREAATRLEGSRSNRPRRFATVPRVAGAAALLLVGIALGSQLRWRALPAVAPKPVTPAADPALPTPAATGVIVTTPPLPAPAPQAPAPDPPAQPAVRPDTNVRNASPPLDIDAEYGLLRQRIDQRASRMATLGDVKGLLALRDATLKRDLQLGGSRSALMTELLNQLDAKLDDARIARLKRDAQEFRRQ